MSSELEVLKQRIIELEAENAEIPDLKRKLSVSDAEIAELKRRNAEFLRANKKYNERCDAEFLRANKKYNERYDAKIAKLKIRIKEMKSEFEDKITKVKQNQSLIDNTSNDNTSNNNSSNFNS